MNNKYDKLVTVFILFFSGWWDTAAVILHHALCNYLLIRDSDHNFISAIDRYRNLHFTPVMPLWF